MISFEMAYKLRALIEQAVKSLPDKEASEGAILFPRLKTDGSLVQAGTRINWNGTIKKAAVDLWDTAENNPENAPSLWSNIEYKDGYRIIPDTLTVTTAFGKDECGWWDGELYRSKYEGNVHTPAVNPDGWEKV